MSLTIAPSRSARSYSHHWNDELHESVLYESVPERSYANKDFPVSEAVQSTRAASPNIRPAAAAHPSPLCVATESELHHLRELLSDSLSPSTETSRHIAIKIQAFPLINVSNFALSFPVDRIDRAHALIGTGWLNAFAFIQATATLVRRYTSADAEIDHEVSLIWQQGSVLADTAELMSRMSGQGNSVLSWLCGWMSAIVEIDVRLRAHAARCDKSTIGNHHFSAPVIAGRLLQIVSALDSQNQFSLPDRNRRPYGPWCVVSSASRLIHIERRLPLMAESLAELPPTSWPPSLCALLAKQFARQFPTSVRFAIQSWNSVQLSRERLWA